MPFRLQLVRPNAVHSCRQHTSPRQIPLCLRLQKRSITADEKPLPTADKPGPGPNQDQLPHVSEEADALSKITGEGGPQLEQGTPIQEILQRDKSGQEKAPKVIQEELNTTAPKGSRQYSTSARRAGLVPMELMTFEEMKGLAKPTRGVEPSGHEFELPSLPLPRDFVMKYRYDPIIKQFTNLMMRDGKLSKAQRNTALILQHLRTAPPPRVNPLKPLIPGSPPVSHLPLNPVQYLVAAVDSLAPLMRIKALKGAAGGGRSLQIPIPLNLRQRRRQAVMWILDAAEKRRTKGSGHGLFAQKVAEELIAVVEGRSGLWERRSAIHKLGVGARANIHSRN
ncbi:hypothetical protein MMC07_008805 [Pseudocyphellaria aurata]|nr:hypothetical protein [Pseudocyphellaria aurata]